MGKPSLRIFWEGKLCAPAFAVVAATLQNLGLLFALMEFSAVGGAIFGQDYKQNSGSQNVSQRVYGFDKVKSNCHPFLCDSYLLASLSS